MICQCLFIVFISMDVIYLSLGFYSIFILIRGLDGSYVIDIKPGIWNTLEEQCPKKCKYGYKADVEGKSMCKCLDPCAHIFCPFEKTKCVVQKPETCRSGNCKYEATCKRVFDWKRKIKFHVYNNEVYDSLQRDSNAITDLCSRQPSATRHKQCQVKQAWYYYDGIKGVCVRFKGCFTYGDFFSKRKDCKRSCIKRRRAHKSRSLKELQPKVCHLNPENNSMCTKVRRIWYFDHRKGRCIKSLGCTLNGNSFRRRIDCKETCKRKQFKKRIKRQRTF